MVRTTFFQPWNLLKIMKSNCLSLQLPKTAVIIGASEKMTKTISKGKQGKEISIESIRSSRSGDSRHLCVSTRVSSFGVSEKLALVNFEALSRHKVKAKERCKLSEHWRFSSTCTRSPSAETGRLIGQRHLIYSIIS